MTNNHLTPHMYLPLTSSLRATNMSSSSKGKHSESKIAVLGMPAVGKSATVVRFMTRRFIWEYDPTLECTYKHHASIDDEAVTMEILDTAGQEETIQREAQVRWADGFVLIYSINDRHSFEEIASTKQYLDEIKRTNVQCVLLANKTDLHHERKVSAVEGEKLAMEMACAFYETSASDGTDEIQEAFWELHREIRRKRALEGKSRRRSSAAQVKQVINKVFRGIQNSS